jgi:hypothetical protein
VCSRDPERVLEAATANPRRAMLRFFGGIARAERPAMSNGNLDLQTLDEDTEMRAARELGTWRSRMRTIFLLPSVSFAIGVTIWMSWLLGIGLIFASIACSRALVNAMTRGKAHELGDRFGIDSTRMSWLAHNVGKL